MNPRAVCRFASIVTLAFAFMLLVSPVSYSADAPPSEPTAAPSPTPSSGPKALVGGPISIGVTGNVIAGQQVVNDGVAGAASTTQSNAGAVIDISRRTADAFTDVMLPASLSGHAATLGQLTAEYDTTRASYAYGSQTIGALGLIPIGSTTRGSTILLPRRHGDVSLYAGAASGVTSYIVKGARLRFVGTHGYGAVAAYDATAQGGGRVDGLVAGIASNPGKLSGQLEAAIESNHHLNGANGPDETRIPDGTGVAVEGRVDDGGSRTYSSLTLRDLSPNYISLGGTTQADRFVGLTVRSQAGHISYTGTVENERTGFVGAVTTTQRSTVTATAALGNGASLQSNITNQTSRISNDTQWNGVADLSFAMPFHATTITSDINVGRSTDALSTPQANVNYQIGLGRTFSSFSLQAQAAVARQIAAVGDDKSTTILLGLTHTSGRFGYTLSTQLGRQTTPGSQVAFVAPTLSVTRRLSSAFFATVNSALNYRRDALNPANNGRSLQFSFSLGAPFSFGDGLVSGRADPRLPATISGVVQTDATSPGFASQQQNGLRSGAANIAVVLDNQQIVRTDLSGRFQFRFVPAGRHAITIDPASLPRGSQPAMPITSLNVQGGQVAQVVLAVGAYGSVEGSIELGLGAGGTLPIPDVAVVLDGQTRVVSDARGNFAFGGLAAGKHSVAIVPETFPASFVSVGDNTRTVNVTTGEATHVEFAGAPLGSIAGRLTYDNMQDRSGKGVANAYVVAEPGGHAVVTDDDGTYLLDNLGAGTYTLSVDPETLGDELGVVSDREVVTTLAPAGKVTGIDFRIGEAEKGVVFTFKGNDTNVVLAHALASRVPPGASVTIVVTTSHPVTRVAARLREKAVAFTYVAARKAWIGVIHIPTNGAGKVLDVPIDATGTTSGSADVSVTIDPTLPIATFGLTPTNPVRGQYVHVRAHLFVDAHAGDRLVWQDGSATTLSAPRAGRYFEFDVKITALPFRGTLLTPDGELPVTLVH